MRNIPLRLDTMLFFAATLLSYAPYVSCFARFDADIFRF